MYNFVLIRNSLGKLKTSNHLLVYLSKATFLITLFFIHVQQSLRTNIALKNTYFRFQCKGYCLKLNFLDDWNLKETHFGIYVRRGFTPILFIVTLYRSK